VLIPFKHIQTNTHKQTYSSYPHGYGTTLGLFATVAGGFAATSYAFASCRFVVISFVSTQKDFEYAMGVGDPNGGDSTRNFRIAAGLFTWSDQGQCMGYRQTMLEEMSQSSSGPIFEAVRIMAVLAILFSITMLVWIILMTTLSMRRIELWSQRIGLGILVLLVGLSFLTFSSALCSDSVGDRSDVVCTLDQGGLVAIAATILWIVGLLISIVFVRMPGTGDLVLIEGELRSEFEERQNNRKRQIAFKALQRERKEKAKAMQRQRRDLERQVVTEEERNKEREARQHLTESSPEPSLGATVAVPLAAAAAGVATVAVATASETPEPDEEMPEMTMADVNADIDIEPETQFPAEALEDAERDIIFTNTLDNIVSICGPNDEAEI
jgi:hypothetical protein